MVNTYQKGWRTVNKGRKLLEASGWLTGDVEAKGKFRKSHDLFNLFDYIAIKPGRTKLIQFKTNRMPTYKPYKEFAEKYPQFEVEIWCWVDRKGFKYKKFKGR